MKIDLIHVGMMKTGTTYMQTAWMDDEKYSISSQGSLSYLQEMRNFAVGKKLNKENMSVSFDLAPKPKQKFILSNEGFSTAYLNEPEYQDKIPNFISQIALSLSGFNHSGNVLIVVRDPISWIRSIYNQSINQGSYGCAQDFVDNQKLLIKHSLDMKYIVSSYTKHFKNVVVLPFELFKKDKETFWKLVSEKFKIPVVTTELNIQNASFTDEEIFLLSKLNHINNIVIKGVSNSTSYNNPQEKKIILENAVISNKWLYRRFIEHSDKEYIQEMKGTLGVEAIPSNYFDFTLGEDLLDSIESNYLNFLENYIDDEYMTTYREKFDKYKSDLASI